MHLLSQVYLPLITFTVPKDSIMTDMKLFQMVWCVWWGETFPGRVELRFSTTVTGERCVTTTGPSSTQWWSADSWATGMNI